MDTTCRLARTSGGLHSKPLPRAGSDMGSDQVAQGIILSGLETLQGRNSTLSLGLFPPPSHPLGRKAFPYLQPSWPCSMSCPPGPKTFCPELPLAPPALLPGLCLPGTGLHSALAWIAWRPHQPLPPTGPSPLCTVALPSWALNGAPLFGITCKRDRYAPCHLTRLLTRGCCGSPLVPSHQEIHDPSTTPLWVKLSNLCGFFFFSCI